MAATGVTATAIGFMASSFGVVREAQTTALQPRPVASRVATDPVPTSCASAETAGSDGLTCEQTPLHVESPGEAPE